MSLYSAVFLVVVNIAVSALAQTPNPNDCPCPGPPAGSYWQISEPLNGVLPQQPPAIQCSYPGGACVWDSTGALLNTNQGNCEPQIAANSTACPADNQGDYGVLTDHYQGFACLFIDETGFHPSPLCNYNAIGEPVDDADCPEAEPCSY